MTLHQLRIFESVARHLNITKAAEELHMSQPAGSQQLKLLEQEFGASFHSKNSQGVELTQKGRAFLEAISPILVQVEEVEKRFRTKLNEGQAGFLAVGGSHSFSVTLLPEILMAFKQTHPWVECVLETSDSRSLERRIVNSELEIALITNPSYSPHIALEPYKELEVVAFVPFTSPLAGMTMTLGELGQTPLVVRREGNTLSELAKRGYKLNIAVQCEAAEAVKAAVQTGMGMGVLYRDTIEWDIKKGELKIINVPDMKIKVRSFVAYSKDAPLSANAQNFLNILRQRKAKEEKAGHPKRAA